jgi:hypothetical protein
LAGDAGTPADDKKLATPIGTPASENRRKKARLVDVVVDRDDVADKQKRTIEKELVKFRKTIVQTSIELYRANVSDAAALKTDTAFTTLRERFKWCLLFYGRDINTTLDGDDDFTVPESLGLSGMLGKEIDFTAQLGKYNESKTGDELATNAEFIDIKLRQALLAVPFVPIEEIASMPSFESLMAIPAKMLHATHTDQLDAGTEELTNMLTLAMQLKEMLETSKTLLKKKMGKFDAAQKAATLDKQKKDAQEEKKKIDECAQNLKKSLLLRKQQTLFGLEWEQAGHPCIAIASGDAAAKTEAATSLGVTPLIIKNSEMLKELAEKTTASDPFKWLTKWTEAFPKNKGYKDNDSTVAPMELAQGPQKLDPFFSLAVPDQCRVSPAKLPSLFATCGKPWFFAMSGSYFNSGCERDCLGSIRVFGGGVVSAVLVPGKLMADKIDGLLPAPEAAVAGSSDLKSRLEQLFITMDQPRVVKMLADGVEVYHGVIDATTAPCALVTPPGYFACISVMNNSPAWGFRHSFLAKGELCRDNYDAIAPESTKGRSAVIDLLDMEK